MTTPSIRIADFDTWRPGYGFAVVNVYAAGTTTLASIYYDENCTTSAPNPQTLLNLPSGGINYGKFSLPLYIQEPYQLGINSVDETGVIAVPLTTLVGQDASLATVIPTNASVAGNLDDILARTVNVLDFGPFLVLGASGASATTNTNTLTAAIGQCAAYGGGTVVIPDGTFQVTAFTVPPGVVLVGQGGYSGATTLQSMQASAVVTVSGNEAGLKHLCLDGLSQVTNSIGLYARVVDQVILEEVLIKRFDFGIQLIGGNGNHWKDVWLSDCEIGYQGQGNSLVASTNNGGPLEFCRWDGGIVDTCTTAGIELECIDDLCDFHVLDGIQFNSNTGIACNIIGARHVALPHCAWTGNTTDLQVQDGSPINTAGTNTVIGLDVTDFSFIGIGDIGGAINLSGTLDKVAFRRGEFTLETITLTTPGHNVLEQDCRQISGCTFAGTATSWIISKTYDSGKTIGLTTGNAATIAWQMALSDGQYVLLKARVVARSRSSVDFAFIEIIVGAYCTGATLDYDAQTANFNQGDVATGATSGATGRILAATNSGSTGSLTLQDVNGTFLNNEALTDTGGGAATANGTLRHGTATLDTPTNVHSTNASSFGCAFAVSAQEVMLNVTGLSSTNIEWFPFVDVISSQQIE